MPQQAYNASRHRIHNPLPSKEINDMAIGRNPAPMVTPQIAGNVHPRQYGKIGFDPYRISGPTSHSMMSPHLSIPNAGPDQTTSLAARYFPFAIGSSENQQPKKEIELTYETNPGQNLLWCCYFGGSIFWKNIYIYVVLYINFYITTIVGWGKTSMNHHSSQPFLWLHQGN